MSAHSTLFSFGFQLGDYAQLRAAIDFLQDHGSTVRKLPPELFPGVDHCAFVTDPDGHAIQLYHSMEQVGWEGQPKPASQRRPIDNDAWPEVLADGQDPFDGEVYLGPFN